MMKFITDGLYEFMCDDENENTYSSIQFEGVIPAFVPNEIQESYNTDPQNNTVVEGEEINQAGVASVTAWNDNDITDDSEDAFTASDTNGKWIY